MNVTRTAGALRISENVGSGIHIGHEYAYWYTYKPDFVAVFASCGLVSPRVGLGVAYNVLAGQTRKKNIFRAF